MAISKTFETLFRLNAKWIGGPGVAKAQAALHKTAASAQRVNVRLKGMATSVFAGAAAYGVLSRAVGGVVNVLQRSIAAAADAQEVHDNLSLSIERNAKHYSGLAGKSLPEVNRIIEENVQMLIKQSEQMEKTGHDAETLQAGWEKLIGDKALSPQQVKDQSKAFSDVLSKMFGANATQEESVQLGEMWSDTILQGNLALVKRLGLDQGHLLQLRKINSMVRKGEISAEEGIKRRQRFMVEAAKKFEGATEQAFDKPSGKIAHMQTMFTNILENMGKPFVARAGSMADSFKDIAVAMGPVSEELAKIVDVHLKRLSDWLAANKTELPERLATIVSWLQRIQSIWDKINAVKNTPFIALMNLWQKGWGEPTRMAQLPGAPSGVTNPALQQGEAGRRNAEAQAKAAAAASFAYGEGYPTAMPPKINAPAPAPTPPPTSAAAAAGRVTPGHFANVRYNNPGAQYPGASSRQFGSTGTAIIGGGAHKIAQFPTPVHGAASNMQLLSSKYVGMTVSGAMKKWSGGSRAVPGPGGKPYPGNMRITPEMARDPSFMIPFMQAIASGEAPGRYPMSQAQWAQAFEWYSKGAPQGASLRGATSALGRPAGAGGTQNISMNSPVTVNGVAPGREQMVARQVRTAVRDPMRQLLDQIKAARNYESRLGYV